MTAPGGELLSVLLEVTDDGTGWRRRADAARAFAYSLLEAGGAASIHDLPDLKPFTVAIREREGRIQARLTALDAPTAEALLAGAARARTGLHFGGSSARIEHASEPGGFRDACRYIDLLGGPCPEHVELLFPTATAFKRSGDRLLPLPDPELMVQSWGRRWNAWCPHDAMRIDEGLLGRLQTRVGLSRCSIRTVPVRLSRGTLAGFTGEVTLQPLRLAGWTLEERAVFGALVRFSRFCGTGIRTTEGMGLTLPAAGGGEGPCAAASA